MAKYHWSIVKEKDSGKYYPVMDDRDIKWDIDRDSFVNQNGVEVDLVYSLGKVTDNQRDMFWKGFQVAKESIERNIKKELEEKQIEKIGSYIVLQKDKTRYTFQYDKHLGKYDERKDMVLITGGTSRSQKISVEKAFQEIDDLKKKGYLEFRNPKEISWYATIENNTPYQEIWEERDGVLIPIESHSVGIFTVDGCSCEKVDEWECDEDRFVLGNSIDDIEFYCAFEKGNRGEIYEFDHRPSRDEVENAHINFLSEQFLNAMEEEFGADGHRAFPRLNDELKINNEVEKNYAEVLKEVLELAKNELKEAGDSIGYTMPDEKHHLFIYVDSIDGEKIYGIEPNRVEDGAHEPFTGDTYGASFGDFGELMVGCMWAMECFERDKTFEKESSVFIYDIENIKQRIFDSFKEGRSTFELGGWQNGMVEVYCNCDLFTEKQVNFTTEESKFFYDMEREGQGPAYQHIADKLADCVIQGELQWDEEVIASKDSISLRDFLSVFDFDYVIVMPNETGERKLRENLLETDDISMDDLDSPMLCLDDLQGAFLGNIHRDRFRLDENLAKNIIDRMDVYINDSVISEFVDVLEDRNIDTSSMNLKDMVKKAYKLGVGEGEVSYQMASYILNPKLIDVSAAFEEGRQGLAEKGIEKVSLVDQISSAEVVIKGKEGQKSVEKDMEKGR